MTYSQTKAYIRKNFTDGLYSGDNPYLSEVTVSSMLRRWLDAGDITHDVYLRLRVDLSL